MTRLTLDTATKRSGFTKQQAWLCRLLIAALFTYYLVYHWHHENKDNGGHLGDFHTFYQAGQFVLWHRDIYQAGPNPAQMYVYPPLIAFLCTPLTLLPKLQAAHVWLVLNAAALLVSVLLICRAMLERLDAPRPGALWVVAALTCLLSENEMRAVLTMLETDPLMLLMFVLGLWWLDRRPTWAGAALAFAFNIKYLTIVALPYLILRRRWRATVGFIVGAVFFALLPALAMGWREDLRCLRVSFGGLLRWVGVPPEASHAIKVHDIGDRLSVSVTSALARVLEGHGLSHAQIMASAGALGLLALAAVFLMYRANGFVLFRWPRAAQQLAQPFRGLVALEWAGLVTVALVFSPDTNTRHLVLAVVVNALAAALLLLSRAGVSRVLAVAAVILIFLAFIMPFGTKGSRIHQFYFGYGIPCDALLVTYLLILWTGLKYLRAGEGKMNENVKT